VSAIGTKASRSVQARAQTSTVPAPVAFRARSRELLRAMLLDATCAQLLERPWEALSMLEVARAAGVHRSSLYNEFGTREGLIRALLAREAARLPALLSAPLSARSAAPAAALAETFERFLDASRENGLLAALLRPGEAELLALASTRRSATLGRLSGAVQEAWPGLEGADCAQVAELLFRFALSLARFPADGSTAAHVGGLLGSYVQARLRTPWVPPAPARGASPLPQRPRGLAPPALRLRES